LLNCAGADQADCEFFPGKITFLDDDLVSNAISGRDKEESPIEKHEGFLNSFPAKEASNLDFTEVEPGRLRNLHGLELSFKFSAKVADKGAQRRPGRNRSRGGGGDGG